MAYANRADPDRTAPEELQGGKYFHTRDIFIANGL